MAFLNKRVGTSKSAEYVNIYERDSQFHDKSKVRILLFEESGSKGRRLIFDSSMRKSSHNVTNCTTNSSTKLNKLTDMVFGALSLRCREPYFRIHNLSSQNRIMFTQVFPFPSSKRNKYSFFHPYLQSSMSKVDVVYLKAATCDTNLDDSWFSLDLEMTGMHLDSHVFHRNQYNVVNSSSSTIDSGYAEQSYCSFTTSNRNSFNNGCSLNNYQNQINKVDRPTFLTDPILGSSNSVEYYSHTLGLVIILEVTSDKDEYSKYYKKYIAFIECVVFRIRRYIEFAFSRPGILLPLINELTFESTKWLTRMFPYLQEINTEEISNIKLKQCTRINQSKLHSLLSDTFFSKKTVMNLKRPMSQSNESKCYHDEFCELLQTLENKETNFFMSSITTAILTYHLGWITACFPYLCTDEGLVDQEKTSSYNSLWRQITELYGAHGCPIKSAQTIITGSDQNETISKILHFIQYFVRYTNVVSKSLQRINVNKDNIKADMISLSYRRTGDDVDESSDLGHDPIFEMKPTLKKSKTHLLNLTECFETVSKEINLPQEEKVTFLLGENEELINIKPNSPIRKDLSFPNKLNNDIHSNYSSVGKVAFDSTAKEKYTSEYLGLMNSEQRQRKSFTNSKEVICDLGINELNKFNTNKELSTSVINSSSNFCFPEEKNEQVLGIHQNERNFHKITKMKILFFPLPSFNINKVSKASYASNLESNVVGNYVPDMVIQGTSVPENDWILKLKRDLYLTRQIYFFNGHVDESVAIVGDTNKWDVEIISSRVNTKQNSMGTKLDVSTLVVNMLEVLLEMYNLHFCKTYRATHIEQRLLEICIRSCAFSQLLMHTEMCTMDLLTTTLHFELNDIPLLMSAASIIAPQVTKKYGLSFQ